MLAEALLDPGFYAQATSQNSLIIAAVTDKMFLFRVHLNEDFKSPGSQLLA